jgi:ribonuclease E
MSQPRRKRRRRRRGGQRAQSEEAGGGTDSSPQTPPQPAASAARAGDGGGRQRDPMARRSRRGRRGGAPRPVEESTPKRAEELMRTPPKSGHGALSAPPDGRTLEGVIGELQSVWGVPQNPQEFRITVKVAEERESRGQRVAAIEEVREELPAPGPGKLDRPRREKAPAAPRIGTAGTDVGPEPSGAVRRKRSRRRRRRGGSSGGN